MNGLIVRIRLIWIGCILAFVFSIFSVDHAISANCPIPSSGPWPPCAIGTTKWEKNSSNGCVIPSSGVWPACAYSKRDNIPTSTPTVPIPTGNNTDKCVIPSSGPWPACATNGRVTASVTVASSIRQTTQSANPETTWKPPTRLNTPTHTLKQLTNLPADSRVVIRGNIVSTESFSKGYKFTMADNTGRVTLLIWSSVYDDCTQCPFLNIGATVIIKGIVDHFENTLQLVPLFGDAIQVIKPFSVLPGRPAQLGDLRLYHDQRVKIEATVQRLNQTKYGMEIVVNDGTGEADIFLWHNNWQRVTNKWQITTGTIIRVAGMVSDYRGFYTVTPSLPYDLEIVTFAP